MSTLWAGPTSGWAAPTRLVACWSGPPASIPRTRRCRSTWGTSMLRWGRRRGHAKPTSDRSISKAAMRSRCGANWVISTRSRGPETACAALALSLLLGAGCASRPVPPPQSRPAPARSLLPWQMPQEAYGSQRLYRVSYSGPDGEGSFKVTLRLVSPGRYQVQAADPLGRSLWSLDLNSADGLWLNHHRRHYP